MINVHRKKRNCLKMYSLLVARECTCRNAWYVNVNIRVVGIPRSAKLLFKGSQCALKVSTANFWPINIIDWISSFVHIVRGLFDLPF